MTEQEILYTMMLTRVPHLNVTNQRLLLSELGSATAVFENRKDISAILPEASSRLTDALASMEYLLPRAEEELAFAQNKHIRCLCYNDTDYPARMRECADAPVLLYYRGTADLNTAHVLDMVGTRHCTEYGRDVCRHFLADLGRLCPDTLVISGLAYGIDIEAHRQALHNGLDTVGVLAHGLDQIYPRMHRDTAVEMTRNGGLLTEFMSRTNADKVNFIRRNRIVAGLSDATIVVESAEKGGSLITADIAESYHRDVFAVPGRICDPYSKGCNNLIRDNRAVILQSAEDFVKAMGWHANRNNDGKAQSSVQRELFPKLTDDEQTVVGRLTGCDSKQINQLAVETNFPIHKIIALLFSLEMKGVVKQLSGGMYRLLR